MNDKKQRRTRRAVKVRANIKVLGVTRLTVHKTNQHIYAQLITADNKVIAIASTLDKEIKGLKAGGNIAAAEKVGQLIGKKAKAAGIKKVAFDRSGFRYHGRIKALAQAARDSGLDF